MIQARKDVNAPSKEQKTEEQVVSTTSQRITPSSRTVHNVDQRRAYVTNTLGSPTTVILPEGSSIPEGSALQFRRISLGQQLQHVVTPVQVQGTSSTSESLPINPRCSVTSTQDLPHILVATTSNAPLHTVELQNSIVGVSASMPQQYQTLGNITNVATGGQRTAGSAVIAQPVTQTSITPRIVLNSGMSDVYALRLAPTTLGGGSAAPQIMLLDSSASLTSSSDVTKVHSYSLASAAVSSLGSTNTMQKIVISTSGQALQVTGLTQKPLVNPSRASVKRQLITTTPTRTELFSVNNNDVLSHISVVNKLLYGLLPLEGKIPSIPSSPKSKRIKLEKTPITNKDVLKRRKIVEHLTRKIQLLKNKYYQTQTEFYFLKTGNNMADYVLWRKKIPSALLEYLKAHRFDPHDDIKIILEILSQSVSQSTGNPVLYSQGTHADHLLLSKSVSHATSSHSQSLPHRTSSSPSSQRSVPVSSSPSTPTKSVRQPTFSHKLALKHNSISSVYDSQIGSQEEIVERAKQEAYVMQRVGELRKDGLWSFKRLPKVAEAPRSKAHYDYLLEEMVWLATDFAQERKWKKATAKKCARMITKYFQEKEIKAERAERDEQIKLRKIASTIAREVKQFWNNIEKLVEYKHQTWLEEKRKKVLDVHLNFIVDQTEKYSSWLTQGMNQSNKGSPESSRGSSPLPGSAPSTPLRKSKRRSHDFEPSDSEEDDEETIKMEEENLDVVEQNEEIKLLQQESEMPFEDFLESLPPEFFNDPVPLEDSKDKSDLSLLSMHSDGKPEKGSDDDDFEVSEEEEDDEQTILEQEENENNVNHEEEIKDLQTENEMSIEQLREKYAAAYTSDFELETSEQQSEEERDTDDSEEEQSDEDMSVDTDDKNDHSLLKSLTDDADKDDSTANPSKEITDIAATAESFQPKGNTLSTTQVCTKVPFLLKHQLREYQHIGLDWLNAMYDKKLNGILADEMGLGKTIQTISILAHLACEKGVWGPHLIVVPTSVMLNWEMEFKKWCPAFKILTYYGTPKERKQKRVGWTKFNAFHVCITSYKLVVQDHQSFRRKKWKYLILDEAHHIKNFKSQRWQLLLNFQSSHRLLLTGTPLQNNLMELWSLMHFLMPNVFQSHKEFREWFVNPFTGMIEGSHEYNDSLIKRLHKVLRPFLLRRLKCEVEKQLPKKYEHIIVCRLSNRQRYLYDDFMSQTKTKETLATGNFMSVINILMQLRKVCNHPNMFEERPTVSPFLMEGITFHTSSLAYNALEYDPFKQVNLQSLNLLLADLELSLTAFAAHRVKKFQTPPKLIVEIDNLPQPPPPCPAVKMKVNFCNSPVSSKSTPTTNQPRIGSAVAHPNRLPSSTPNRLTMPIGPALPQPQRLMVIPGQQGTPSRAVSPVAAIGSPPVASQPEQYTLQLVQPSGAVASLAPLGGLTLQLQPGPASGNRVQCIQSLIGNIGRVVQTAAGAHFVITSVANSVAEQSQVQPVVTTAIAQPPVAASVTNTQSLVLSTNISTATVLPQVQKIGNSAVVPPVLSTFSRPPNNNSTSALSNQSFHNKPIGRVAPLNVHPPVSVATSSAPVNQNHVQSAKTPVVHSLSKTLPKLEVPSGNVTDRKKSLFYIESLAIEREKERKNSLRLLAKINNRRCAACPIYGGDLIEAISIVNSLKHPQSGSRWLGKGHVNCLNAINAQNDTKLYWDHTSALSNIIKTPDEVLEELKEIINRFVFVIPAVSSPSMKIHISHPSPWRLNEERMIEKRLINYVSPASAFLHPIVSNMKTQFPELRLIQYDCGKLQRLAQLLWELKSGHHRVLIFTQMTRMLDILEQFLNYHGHTYLRLDGNTKVEQRQALMERFNADKRIFCFILSTRSGGIGVNLTGADTVIFYDSDWNPTMDAQAQDRCHRIGQTRDVHIYRLISERTIEENILRKANQKRVLGDLAIEGGNFNTAFFKKNTIHDLFGFNVSEEVEKSLSMDKKLEENIVESSTEEFSQTQLEQALGMAEEESDKQAAQTACAEAVAELAEFDESIPLDSEGRDNDDKSPAEEELDKLMKQLTPVEKYAVSFLESLQEPVGLEQLKLAEEEIEAQKKDWELGHLKALKEEEERRCGNFGDDDSPLFYSRDSANQVNRSSRSKRNKGRDSLNSSHSSTKSAPPKRRSKRIIKKEKLDGGVESDESNDSEVKDSSKSGKPDRVNNIHGVVNGPKHSDTGLRKQLSVAKSGNLNRNFNSKIAQSPLVIKPFSNPNLVIRTRRASAIEAEERCESESEMSVPSPKLVNNVILNTRRNDSFKDDLACSSASSSPSSYISNKIKTNSSLNHDANVSSKLNESQNT